MHMQPLILSTAILAFAAWPASAQIAPLLAPPRLVNAPGTSDTTNDDGVALGVGGDGLFVAFYSAIDPTPGTGGDRDIHFARSFDNGTTWLTIGAAQAIFATDGADDDREPSITSNAIFWRFAYASDRLQTAGEHDIYWGAASATPGVFSQNGPINNDFPGDNKDDREPCIVNAGNTYVCAWQRNSGDPEWDICFSRSINGSNVWSPVAFLNTNGATDIGQDLHPRLATDGIGTWVAVWQSTENMGGTIGTDNDIFSARSTDDGATWSAPTLVNSTAASDGTASDLSPTIAVDRLSGT